MIARVSKGLPIPYGSVLPPANKTQPLFVSLHPSQVCVYATFHNDIGVAVVKRAWSRLPFLRISSTSSLCQKGQDWLFRVQSRLAWIRLHNGYLALQPEASIVLIILLTSKLRFIVCPRGVKVKQVPIDCWQQLSLHVRQGVIMRFVSCGHSGLCLSTAGDPEPACSKLLLCVAGVSASSAAGGWSRDSADDSAEDLQGHTNNLRRFCQDMMAVTGRLVSVPHLESVHPAMTNLSALVGFSTKKTM